MEKEEGGALSTQQRRYNYKHSSTRMAVECAFGILKTRFRILRRSLEQKTIKSCTRLINTTMVLHNILMNLNDDTLFMEQQQLLQQLQRRPQRQEEEEEEDQEEETQTRDVVRALARTKRDELSELLN